MAYLGMCTMDMVEYVNPLTGETTYGSSSCPPKGFVRPDEVEAAKKQGFYKPTPQQILSPDYPDQYFSEISPPSDADNCARYCAWLASRKGGIVTMEYMERPPGCTCPGEVDAKKQGFPVTKTGAEQYDLIEERVQPGLYKPTPTTLPAPLPSPGTIQLTPQQIEAQVKQIQPAPAGGGLVLAAIAALLMLGA